MTRAAVLLCVVGVCAPVAPAQQAAPAATPAPDPTPRPLNPAADPVAGAPGEARPVTAEAWLRRLESQARGRGGLDARLRYTTRQGLLDDEQVRFGRLRQAAADGQGDGDDDGDGIAADRFRVDLDGEVVDGTLRKLDRTLTWDGERLLDVDALARRASLRAVGGPDELAETLPIPMRVDADDLLARYEVELIDAGPVVGGEPAPVHLLLRSRDEPDADPLEVWFDAESGLPLRGRSGRAGGDTQTVDLVGPAVVDGFEEGLFSTAPPTGPGWTLGDAAGGG